MELSIFSILKDYQQTPNKIMNNQGENKNRNNTFDSHEFIHYIADMKGSLSIFHIYRAWWCDLSGGVQG